MIIWVPVQTAEWSERGDGTFRIAIGVQESVDGSYLPPTRLPPMTIIRLPVHTAASLVRSGAFTVDTEDQAFLAGS